MKARGKLGAQITALWQLNEACMARRSVVCPTSHSFGEPRSASFMFNLNGSVLHGLITRGLYLYEPPTKRSKPTPIAEEVPA